MISGAKEFTTKRTKILSKLILHQIGVISKLYTNMNNVNKILFKYFVNALFKVKNNFCPSFPWTFIQKEHKIKPKKDLRQNTVCLEQQIYASQYNFTQPLVAMVVTFRRLEGSSTLPLSKAGQLIQKCEGTFSWRPEVAAMLLLNGFISCSLMNENTFHFRCIGFVREGF